MYSNKHVLIGNWYEDRNGITFRQHGNTRSTYQNDYSKHDVPVRDDRVLWRIKKRSLRSTIEFFGEHGVHGAYDDNTSTLYDVNCALAYSKPTPRRYVMRAGRWKPEQNFTANYGPGRSELVKKKREFWNSVYHDFKPGSEYRRSYTME